MMRRLIVLGSILVVAAAATGASATDFTVLTYHDVADDAAMLTYDGITLRNLAMHFDWLRANGYRVVSVDDLLAAQLGARALPPRAVLVTFDDGYRSFYTHVYPLLLAFNYPAVFSVVGSFLDAPPRAEVRYGSGLVARGDFVSWEELREMQRSGLVEVASHTYGLHTTVFINPQGGEIPAAVGHQFVRRRSGSRIEERYRISAPPPRFGDIRSLLDLRSRLYSRLSIALTDSAADYAYNPRTGRYETDDEYRKRVRDDLQRSSDLLVAQVGARPRVITWPYGRWNETTVVAAREVGMPISLTLDPERADVRELGRIGRFYAANNPDLDFLASTFTRPARPALLRGLCVNLDEMYAPSEEEREARLGRILDRVLAFRPNVVVLATASSAPGAGVYFPTDRLPVRADLFSRAAWQLRSRIGMEVFAWLPTDQVRGDADTMIAAYGALAKSVPVAGMSLGPAFLTGSLSPGAALPAAGRWDPRTPRRLRAAQDRARLPEEARLGMRLLDAVARYQPTLKMLDVVDLPRLRRPAEVAVDAADYLAVRWDGRPEEALRILKDQGWLEGDHWGRLVYWSRRGAPAEWRRVQGAGLLNSVYCPERLLDGAGELAAMSEVAGAASYPFRP
jgi:peptidoglycan/xylan/chitin deacetylase (PgdA/CDA1 family)